MREDGYINSDQEKTASDQLENVVFQSKGASFKAPHFVQYVQNLFSPFALKSISRLQTPCGRLSKFIDFKNSSEAFSRLAL